MTKHRLLEPAKNELYEAKKYYDRINLTLGRNFIDEISNSISLIKENPFAFPVEKRHIRKCIVRKFPYKILYAKDKHTIIVVAIMHQKRKPDYWINRI